MHSITIPAVRSLNACSSAATSFAGTNFTPGSSGSKSRAVLRLSGDGECADRPAVEGVLERNNFVFLCPDLAPVRRTILSAPSIASVPELQKERAREPAHARQALGQWALVFVVVEIRRVQQQARLLADYLDDSAGARARARSRRSGDEVEVALPLVVVEVATAAFLENERVTGIIRGGGSSSRDPSRTSRPWSLWHPAPLRGSTYSSIHHSGGTEPNPRL